MSSQGEREAIEAALHVAGIGDPVVTIRELSRGKAHRVLLVQTANGETYIAKTGQSAARSTLVEEAFGLQTLAATNSVRTPHVLATITRDSHSVLLMTRVRAPDLPGDVTRAWRNFGEDLAAMHLAPLQSELARGYGFPIDNHIGATPQINAWREDWVTFNIDNRFMPQIRLAKSRGMLNAEQSRTLERVVQRLPAVLPSKPLPSLLHGDLWSGNAVLCAEATFAVIDPAPSIGDALADIAMMELFGGFGQACFDAWAARMNINLRTAVSRTRVQAYQLYHVLNHVNIFGGGCIGQAMSLARGILSASDG